jgi:hypothetical protein
MILKVLKKPGSPKSARKNTGIPVEINTGFWLSAQKQQRRSFVGSTKNT